MKTHAIHALIKVQQAEALACSSTWQALDAR
jgi:hypothetical protein